VYLRRLSLEHFRCYVRLDLTLPCETVVIAGANAQGKTSILEAVYMLATTRAPYSVPDRQLLRWQALEQEVLPFARVRGELERAGGTRNIEILLHRPQAEEGAAFAKRARVDGVPRRAIDVIGELNVVLFTPRDIEVVAGPPAERRRYLDGLLCQVDRAYCRALSRYNRTLTQRNQLLRQLRDRGRGRGPSPSGREDELAVWDTRLAEDGALLIARRRSIVTQLAALADEIHHSLSSAPLTLSYECTIATLDPQALEPPSAEDFSAALAARRSEAIARGQTLQGPHRDELRFEVEGIDMRPFGSRGQQRTVTLALKLAEARLMWKLTGERPVLLLDDVLGELDGARRHALLAHIDPRQQVLVTTTDAEALPRGFADEALVLQVAAGRVIAATRGGVSVTPPTGEP
jgi:DNA replication and repair protein RecF